MVRAMRRRTGWYRGLVWMTLASLIWGQAVWPVWSLLQPGLIAMRLARLERFGDGLFGPNGSSGWTLGSLAEQWFWPGSQAQAAVLTWDANTAVSGAQDGSGTWNTSNNNWWTGSANAIWSNTAPDSAVIGAGTATDAGTYTITLGSNITVGGGTAIQFNNPNASGGTRGYEIAGGGYTLTLATPTINVNYTTPTGAPHPTISAPIAGIAGLTKTGSGTLRLTGVNTFTGGITVNAGALEITPASGNLPSNNITLGGGTARIYGASTTVQDPGVNGLNAYYYNVGTSISSVDSRFATELLIIPDRVIQRIDTHPQTLNLPMAVGTDYPRVPVVGFQVPDRLAMMWKGLINITTGGTYTFRANHDDSFSLYIDGQVVLPEAAWRTTWREASISLTPGPHSIVIKFTQGAGGKHLEVQYSGPDTIPPGGSSPEFRVLGSTPGVLTTGALLPVSIGQVGGSGTLEIYSDMSASGFTGSGTFTLTSPTISTLTINGLASLTAATTLAPTTGALIFKQGISGGYALTVAGPYLTRFEATNTYTGTTTVTGGRLELAAPSNAIPGSLTINASNTSGLVANVQLKASEQIANTATVTVRNNSILDLGPYNETIGYLTIQESGQIWGTGTLTIPGANLTTSTFESGRILANLGGGTAFAILNKTTSGTLILAGNNSYQGITNVQAGVLNIRHGNALGASGTGNTTSVSSVATLELQGGINVANEGITVVGTGHTWAGVNLGALRNVSGVNTLGQTLTLGGNTLIRSESGNLILANATSISSSAASNLTIDGAGEVTIRGTWNLSGGTLTKQGRGTLTFDQSLYSFPTVNW
ncbi:MAG: autotransporter-associated beta strand repeat-containing protein, partial [Thermoguttaceae bacterium]|nr:autotransporter-associated beta strand repeat-containing protein [Thermoguttaceae bacterium]